MKRLILYILAIALFISSPAFLLTGYAKEHQPISQDVTAQRKQFEKNMEERLNRLGVQLEELRVKAAAMKEKANKNLNKYLAEAEKKQKIASQKLEMVQKESEKKWGKISTDLSKAADDFEKAFEKAKSHFKD